MGNQNPYRYIEEQTTQWSKWVIRIRTGISKNRQHNGQNG
jgi:hypothetical protein